MSGRTNPISRMMDLGRMKARWRSELARTAPYRFRWGMGMVIAFMVLGQVLCPRAATAQRQMWETTPEDPVVTVPPITATADPMSIVLGNDANSILWTAGSTTMVHLHVPSQNGFHYNGLTLDFWLADGHGVPSIPDSHYCFFYPPYNCQPITDRSLYFDLYGGGYEGDVNIVLIMSVPSNTTQQEWSLPLSATYGMYQNGGTMVTETRVFPCVLTVSKRDIYPGGAPTVQEPERDYMADWNGPFRKVTSRSGGWTGMATTLKLPATDRANCNIVSDMLTTDAVDVYTGGDCGPRALDIGMSCGHTGGAWKMLFFAGSGISDTPASSNLPPGGLFTPGDWKFRMAVGNGQVTEYLGDNEQYYATWDLSGWNTSSAKTLKRCTSIAQKEISRFPDRNIPPASTYHGRTHNHAYASGSWVYDVEWKSCKICTSTEQLPWTASNHRLDGSSQGGYPGAPYVIWQHIDPSDNGLAYSDNEKITQMKLVPLPQ